MTTFVINI